MPESYTDTPLLGERFDAALAYALAHHRRQLRKGTEIPYASHLLAVTALVLEMGGTEDEAIGAMLHDLVEDGGGPAALAVVRERFGEVVADIVEANSDTQEAKGEHDDWKERKTAYVASIATKPPDALLVSLADKLHNARSIQRDLRTHGDELWARFRTGSGPAIRWYYGALVDAFEQRRADLGAPGQAGIDELRLVVEDIRRLATAGA